MFKKITVPFRRFAHVHVDLVGPLPPSHGYTYLLMCIDKSTGLREVNPMVGILRRSVPLPCSMDGSHALESQQSSQGTEAHNSPPPCGWPPFFLLNIRHNLTTAFHPQSNSITERFHRQLKNSLWSRLASSGWFEHLPWISTAPATDCFPNQKIYSVFDWCDYFIDLKPCSV